MRPEEPIHRRRRLTKLRLNRGFTLIEVVLSALMASVLVCAVFSVALTAKRDKGKSLRQAMADHAARSISDRLQMFVAGCNCDYGTGVCSNAIAPCPVIGPTRSNPTNTWSISNHGTLNTLSDNDPTISDSCGGPGSIAGGFWSPLTSAQATGDCFALMLGSHTLTVGSATLGKDILQAPYYGYVVYYVWDNGAVALNPIDPAADAFNTNVVGLAPRIAPNVSVTVQWYEPNDI